MRQSNSVVISRRLFETGRRVLTVCLSPNCLVPESQVNVQVGNKEWPKLKYIIVLVQFA
jgi:hypothetical protein